MIPHSCEMVSFEIRRSVHTTARNYIPQRPRRNPYEVLWKTKTGRQTVASRIVYSEQGWVVKRGGAHPAKSARGQQALRLVGFAQVIRSQARHSA